MSIDIEFVDGKTGNIVQQRIEDPPASFFQAIESVGWTDKQIETLIDRLNVSADTKAHLAAFAKVTVKVGRQIVRIGRKIVDSLFAFLRSFPAMGFGVIFALVVGALISTIPLLGAVLGPIALTLGTALGAVFGAHLDLKNPEFQARPDAFMNELRPLSA